MDDRDFFDHLVSLWARTTGSEDRFWMPEVYTDNSGRFKIYAVGQDESRKLVASGLNERDADFIAGIHGCVADLARRLHDALDEADRADYERDSRECRIAELEMEVAALRKAIDGLSKEPPWKNHDVHAE